MRTGKCWVDCEGAKAGKLKSYILWPMCPKNCIVSRQHRDLALACRIFVQNCDNVLDKEIEVHQEQVGKITKNGHRIYIRGS